MQKVIAVLAIATLTTSPVLAQTSAAARAQQLQKLEEDLNSPDPNLRLAAFEVAAESQSSALRERAFSIAFASSDSSLANIAVKFAICGNSSITIRHGYDRDSANMFNFMETGQSIINISNCSVADGKADIVAQEVGGRVIDIGDLVMRGNSVNISYQLPYDGFYSRSGVVCSVSLARTEGAQLRGRLSCPRNPSPFGPVEALIDLR